MWDEVNSLHANKRQSFLQCDTNIFCGRAQACSDNQSNCKILRRVASQKRIDGLPR